MYTYTHLHVHVRLCHHVALTVAVEKGAHLKTSYPYKKRHTQHWHFMPNGLICNRSQPEIVFDIAKRSKKDGASVYLYEWHGNDNQLWRKDFNIPVKKKKQKKSKKSKKSKKKRGSDDEASDDDDDDDDDSDDED